MATITPEKPAETPVELQTGKASPPLMANEMNRQETLYMRGGTEPVTSSVLISNSKYLNSPLYRDGWAQSSLRRLGHDLSTTYHIPMMSRAIADVTDQDEFVRLIAEEKKKNPAFAAWLDERKLSQYDPAELGDYADGTLGAAIRGFLQQPGFDIEFVHKGVEPKTDLEYLRKRGGGGHDIEHFVTGFGPNLAGEIALSFLNVTATSRFVSPELAQYITQAPAFQSIAAYKRATLHYPAVMTTYLDAMQRAIAAGLAIRMPLFMVRWEDYLDWQLPDIAADLGFVFGPGADWDWTDAAGSG